MLSFIAIVKLKSRLHYYSYVHQMLPTNLSTGEHEHIQREYSIIFVTKRNACTYDLCMTAFELQLSFEQPSIAPPPLDVFHLLS